ncbi:MAG TPA: hypothetical protein VI757_07905 [Bacteroidia bacterium]|nr:hypothetical protein [Bacteroidia bacterium]
MKTIKLVLSGVLLLSAVTIISCSKDDYCSTCVVKSSNGSVIKNYGEKCGTATDVDNYEASSKNDAAQLSGTCSCERK